MKGEEQIIDLLMQTLQKLDVVQEKIGVVERKQDVMQQKQDVMQSDIVEIKDRLGNVETVQQAHQKVLRTLLTGQKRHQDSLENMLVLLDSITRMQRDHGRRLDRLEAPNAPDMAA